jgi:hypothetical protein
MYAEFSHDGKRLVTASEDNTAQVWDVRRRQQAFPPLRHPAQVREAHFSPDDHWIVSACGDHQTAHLWDADTGEPLTPPIRHPWPFVRAQFVQGNKAVLTRRSWKYGKGVSSLWELQSDSRPLKDLSELAQLLSGYQDSYSGVPSAHSFVDLERSWRRLRPLYPQDFSVSREEVMNWHQRQAAASEQEQQWEAAAFHRKFLAEAAPENRLFREREILAHREILNLRLNAERSGSPQ